MREVLWVVLGVVVAALAAISLYARRAGRRLVTPGQRMTYQALHTANLAAPSLRAGLTPEAMQRALGPLRSLIATKALVVADAGGVIASDGIDDRHCRLIRH